MTVSTNIIIYLFSKFKTVGGRSLLSKIRTIFITKHDLAYTNSDFCHVFERITAFVTFQCLGIINNSSQNTYSLLLNIANFVNNQIRFFECFLNLNVCVIHKKQIWIFLFIIISLNVYYITKNVWEIHPKSLIQIWEILQKHHMFLNASCAQSVSLLQNNEMFVPKHDMRQRVYLLQKNDMFENEKKNRQKLQVIQLIKV